LTKNRSLGLKHDGFNEQYQVLMEKTTQRLLNMRIVQTHIQKFGFETIVYKMF